MDNEFAEIFSSVKQNLSGGAKPNLAGDAVKFETTVISTPGLDVSQAAATGKITVKRAGWYHVNAKVESPLKPGAAPLSLGVFKDGNPVVNSFVHCAAGSVLEFSNSGQATLDLPANANGLPSSSLQLMFLKDD